MIKKLSVFDFDGCLIDSPMPETGKIIWHEKTGLKYPYKGWWSKPESLNNNIFSIKPFPNVLNILNKEKTDSQTFVMILTSRLEKLRPQVEKILTDNNIVVDKLDMKSEEKTKGEKILEYIKQFPDLSEIDVYDDRNSDIVGYAGIKNLVPENIKFNIYHANKGSVSLLHENNIINIINIINEEINNFIKK
jgi:hypothetical protein